MAVYFLVVHKTFSLTAWWDCQNSNPFFNQSNCRLYTYPRHSSEAQCAHERWANNGTKKLSGQEGGREGGGGEREGGGREGGRDEPITGPRNSLDKTEEKYVSWKGTEANTLPWQHMTVPNLRLFCHDHITVFKTLYRRTSIKNGAHIGTSHIHASTKCWCDLPLPKVQRYSCTLNTNDAIEAHDRIIFDFYTKLSHIVATIALRRVV